MTMTELTTITTENVMQVTKDMPFKLQSGRFFIPIEKGEEETKGLLVFYGNLHYLTIKNEFLLVPSTAIREKVAAIMNRSIEQDRYEAFEFMSAEAKYAILNLQKLVTKYHPNLSVWNITSSEQFFDELEEEMMRNGVEKTLLDSEMKEAMQMYVGISLKLDRMAKYEGNF